MVRRIWRVIKVVIMGLIRDHNFSVLSTPKLNTEAYRSGHNGTDSKSVVPHGTVGSNPTRSATPEQSPLCSGLFFCKNKPSARSLAPPFRKKSRSAHLFGPPAELFAAAGIGAALHSHFADVSFYSSFTG